MGLVAGALLNLNGRLGLAGWQWLFLIEGLPPILLGIAFLLLLPDSPAHAKWLTEAGRSWITRCVNEGASHNTHHTGSISSVLTDPRVWQIGIFEFCMVGTALGYNFIAPQFIRQATHLNITKVGFIAAGIALLGVPALLLGAARSDRAQRRSLTPGQQANSRYWSLIPFCILMAVGLAICGFSNSAFFVVAGLALVYTSFSAMRGPFWSIPPTFFRGRSSAAAIAAVNIFGNIGGFIFPYYLGLMKDLTGDHKRGLISLSVPVLLAAGIMFSLSRKNPATYRSYIQPPPRK
jgi:ACS family tartrate transporter-like MFS transporter